MRQSGGSRLFKCCISDKSKLQRLQILLEGRDYEGLKQFLHENNNFRGNKALQLRTADLIALYSISNENIRPILGNFTRNIQESE